MLKKRKAAKVFGEKKLAVITGASSGLGLQTTAELLRTGDYHVFGAVRDLKKMRKAVKKELGGAFPLDNFTPLQVDLESFESVRGFCNELNKAKLNRPIDRLVCNAAVYQPSLDYAKVCEAATREPRRPPLCGVARTHVCQTTCRTMMMSRPPTAMPRLTPIRSDRALPCSHIATPRPAMITASSRRTGTSSRCRPTSCRTS